MAEAFLQVVLDNLSSLIKEEIGLILGVNDEMEKLSSTLTTIQAVLEDAEDKQTESKPIRDWLRKLNGLAYEIDDILDECNTHVSKLKHSHSKLSRYSIKKILYGHKIGRKMKQVTKKLDGVAAERAKFHLREMPVDRPREVAAWRETGSLLNDSDSIYGREEDREKIVKMLVDDAREKQHMSVLPIIGVGGLGKTTLAQLVFNDPRVVEHFEKIIWVCVSDDFEIKTLVGKMIESGTRTGKASDLQHLDALQRCLEELLSQKRYLVVLDDVWNDDQQKWYELKDILSCGSTGASIIVTTRLKKVDDIMGTLPAHCLKGLSDEQCWMLLRQRALGPEEEVYPQLEAIGKQIAKKCAGVPLAAKALGGILRFKRTEKEWMSVRESEICKLSSSLIVPALRLSYHHLPLELRQCFAYFAAFPKDDAVEKEELIRLWIAHGFISSKGRTLQVEDVGNEICNELIIRSLFQPHENGEISMHDLIHDLAQSVMENKVPEIQTERNISSASTIRQVNLRQRNVLFPKSFQQDMDISSILEHKSLRVLDASRTRIKDLPPSIGNLIHLRHLNLTFCYFIRTLPNSLCSLWNLQILNLDKCYRLVALPKNMRYLRNLQHLCLDGCDSLSEMPSQMRELSLLKTLSRYVVGLNKGNQLEELQCLNLISGRLEIGHLERVKDHIDAKKANIAQKRNLRHLSLWWQRNTNSLSKLGEDVDEKVLEALEPHQDIEKLSIRGYNGRYFPLWMTNTSFGKILEISIENCQKCRRFPNLGELPHLRKLRLKNVGVDYIFEDEEVGSRNPVLKPQFLALEELDLSDLPNLKGLSKGRLPELPHLRNLSIRNVGVDYIFEDEKVVSNNPVLKPQFLALEELDLFDLPNLKGLSKEQQSKEEFSNLKKLHIKRCSSLILPSLSSLKKLEELECSSSTLALFSELDTLTTLSVDNEEKMTCFPIETLVKFTNLGSLTISGAKETSVPRGGLQGLNKLKFLTIESCPELVELPEEIKHLHNLREIHLFDLLKMACLPQAIQHLSSLRSLFLAGFPELESLPGCLDQLTSLYVWDCPKVASLPSALPNLYYLSVRRCPELERRCERGSGEEWHKIAHIPDLNIERVFVDELRNPDLKKDIEKRIRRKREGSSERKKHYDDDKEGDDKRLSSKGDRAKDVKYRDDKHKDGVYSDKYQEDGYRDDRRRDEKYREEADKDYKYEDDKYREDGEKDARRRDDRHREDSDRDSRRKDEKHLEDVERDSSRRKDEKHREGTERDGRRDDKYYDDGDRDNRRKDVGIMKMMTRIVDVGRRGIMMMETETIGEGKIYIGTMLIEIAGTRKKNIERTLKETPAIRIVSKGMDMIEIRDQETVSIGMNGQQEIALVISLTLSVLGMIVLLRIIMQENQMHMMIVQPMMIDLELTFIHRRQCSPTSNSHTRRDHHRTLRQDDSKYRDYNYDERIRPSTRDHAGAVGGSEKTPSRNLCPSTRGRKNPFRLKMVRNSKS